MQSSIKIGKDCVVCEQAEIKGDVTIGNGCIIHPKARIIAEAGPIILGEGNLIEEYSLIWNRPVEGLTGSTPIMIIGALNNFEVYSQCEALKVGDNNVFEAKSFVGREVVVTDQCVIGSGCWLVGSETIPDHTSIAGKECLRTATSGHPAHSLQMEALAKTLPMYNAIVKKTRT